MNERPGNYVYSRDVYNLTNPGFTPTREKRKKKSSREWLVISTIFLLRELNSNAPVPHNRAWVVDLEAKFAEPRWENGTGRRRRKRKRKWVKIGGIERG